MDNVVERRAYERVEVDLESNFYIDVSDPSKRQFDGIIEDVCEGGMKIFVKNDSYCAIEGNVTIGDCIQVQAVGEYALQGAILSDVFTGEIKIVRISKRDDGIEFGCAITSGSIDYERYVKNKKISLLI